MAKSKAHEELIEAVVDYKRDYETEDRIRRDLPEYLDYNQRSQPVFSKQ